MFIRLQLAVVKIIFGKMPALSGKAQLNRHCSRRVGPAAAPWQLLHRDVPADIAAFLFDQRLHAQQLEHPKIVTFRTEAV
ncbi:hypothetical protein D3C75_1024930 [compost metagenome]